VKIQNLLKTSSEWVRGENGGNRIVFSSRLRLARNVNHHPFPGWAKKAEREKVLALVQPAVAELPEMKEAVRSSSSSTSSAASTPPKTPAAASSSAKTAASAS
jgi:protein arginine kinase